MIYPTNKGVVIEYSYIYTILVENSYKKGVHLLFHIFESNLRSFHVTLSLPVFICKVNEQT